MWMTDLHVPSFAARHSGSYHAGMLIDGLPFEETWRHARPRSPLISPFATLVRSIERVFGARVLFDADRFPYGIGNAALQEAADLLRHSNVITGLRRVPRPFDEPPLEQWSVTCNTKPEHTAGGISFRESRNALAASLAEALERYLWYEATDFFRSYRIVPPAMIGRPFIDPRRFVGFTEKQRAENKHLHFYDAAAFSWTEGYSWTENRRVFIPAQTVSAREANSRHALGEPVIRPVITTGLATWPTKRGAVLRGALEIIERDAFMIMWLNTLSLPLLPVDDVADANPNLRDLVRTCRRYKLDISFVQLLTDAPATVVCAVVSDESDEGPPRTVGVKAHTRLHEAAEGSLLEALRARTTARIRRSERPLPPNTHPSKIRHLDRAVYWCDQEKKDALHFITAGDTLKAPPSAPWEHDDDGTHLSRIIDWAKHAGYTIASVDMGTSSRNPLPWHIHMTVMPDMQPLHQNEALPSIGGDRLKSVPESFGYRSRTVPYTEHPHPFS